VRHMGRLYPNTTRARMCGRGAAAPKRQSVPVATEPLLGAEACGRIRDDEEVVLAWDGNELPPNCH